MNCLPCRPRSTHVFSMDAAVLLLEHSILKPYLRTTTVSLGMRVVENVFGLQTNLFSFAYYHLVDLLYCPQ